MEGRISVVIPCFNGARYIGEAIRSVRRQTHPAHEIIVVDDGSVDDSSEVIRPFSFVTYIGQENGGVATARNRGLQACTGDYVVFLDQDDRLLETAFETGVRTMRAHPDSAFVYGRNRRIDADGRVLSTRIVSRGMVAGYREQLSGNSLVPPSAALFRKEAVVSMGGFDATMAPADDYDLYLRMSRRFPIYFHDEVVTEWRAHDQNQSRNAMRMLQATLRALDAQRRFVQRHPVYRRAYLHGRRRWKHCLGRYLGHQMLRCLLRGDLVVASRIMVFVLTDYPLGLVTCPIQVSRDVMKHLRAAGKGTLTPRGVLPSARGRYVAALNVHGTEA